MADPVYCIINKHSIFVDIELSYNTKKQVGAAAKVCSEESVSTAYSLTLAKAARVG